MTYLERVQEDRRLVMLRLLAETPGYEANSSVMQMALVDFGHNISRDLVHTDLAWLTEQGLLTISALATVQIAKLTTRGLDVAQGRSTVPGVKRPGPGA